MLTSTDETEVALRRAREAIRVRPKDAQLHRMLAELYEQLGRENEALPHLAFLVGASAAPEEMLYVRYAKALYRSGSFIQAAKVLNEGLALFPNSRFLLHNKALNLLLAGSFVDALTVYGELHRLDP